MQEVYTHARGLKQLIGEPMGKVLGLLRRKTLQSAVLLLGAEFDWLFVLDSVG